MTTTTRVLTGFKPTGRLQLGNYLGAVRPLLGLAADPVSDVVVSVVDLHALTVDHDPAALAGRTLEVATTLLTCGLDDRTTLFVQSALPAHTELSYLLESTATYGEMQRMIQFRERRGSASPRLSLLTYPALMAADVLLHRADVVPVGDDQRQHLELTVTLARRFNARYGDVLTVPRGTTPADAARVMDLRAPTSKMGKSGADGGGVLFLTDDVDTLAAKVRRAVTDAEPELTLEPRRKPGVANLASLLGALTGRAPEVAIAGLHGSGALKSAVTEAVVEVLAPIRERHRELSADPGVVRDRLRTGLAAVREPAARTLDDARAAIGLLAA